MKPTVPLIVSSLLATVFGMLHLVDDALYLKAGMPPQGFFIVVLILLVWLCGTLPLTFVFTLLAFAVTAGFTLILSVLGLWSLRRSRP